ncbi:MAG: ATP-binding cassette domain-containing protein [Candidatus Humimicrobiaceae bacterium]
MQEIIRAENLTKRYGRVLSLDNMSFSTYEKEIIGLVGDNGAGKSTLLNILVGLFPPDEGKIFIEGKEVHFSSPADARKKGIEIVYQFGNLIEEMVIYKNFFLGRERIKKGIFKVLDNKLMKDKSEKILQQIGINKDSSKLVGELSGGERQAVALGRAFYFGTKVLLLDEPTTGLSLKEIDRSLKRIKTIRDNTNMSIIFVTHELRHIFPIADRIIVIDRGEKILDKRIEHTNIEEISQLIINSKKEEEHATDLEFI